MKCIYITVIKGNTVYGTGDGSLTQGTVLCVEKIATY